MIKPILSATFLALAIVSSAAATLAATVSLGDRPATAVALDDGRKPVEVLAASGIKSGDMVVDVMPGTGYYSELLGRLVGPKGKVLAIEPPRFLDDAKAVEAWGALINRQPNVVLVKSPPGDALFPAGLDAAFFHLAYHDLYWESEKFKFPRTDPSLIVARLFKAMKQGGTVVVIDHAGIAGIDARVQADKTHRIDPAQVRTDFEKAGFKFAGESALLRKPEDSLNTLVFDPSVRGKTDRFYYRFVKP